jgi:hypothetical protein
MALTIKKADILVAAIMAVSLLTKEVTFVAALMYLLYRKGYTAGTWKLLAPVLILIPIGVLIGYEHALDDMLRDVFIVSKIIVYFWVGVILSENVEDWDTFFKYLKIIALVSAIYHLLTYAANYGEASDINGLRKEAGLQSFVESIAVAVILSQYFSRKFRSLFYKQ